MSFLIKNIITLLLDKKISYPEFFMKQTRYGGYEYPKRLSLEPYFTTLSNLTKQRFSGLSTGKENVSENRAANEQIAKSQDNTLVVDEKSMSLEGNPPRIFKISRNSNVRIYFSGDVTQESIEKLINLLELSKDTYPTERELKD